MRRWIPFALVSCALLVAGCGGDDNGGGGGGAATPTETATTTSTPEDSGGGAAAGDGKQLFASTCGGCHALADAGTTGTVGPDLDDLKPDEATVRSQIRTGGGPMPANLLTGAKADTVAAYVASVAGE